MAIFLPNGIGGDLGENLAVVEPLCHSGNVWFVSSSLGVDAVSPRGLNAQRPLATLAQALTNAADHDIIALLEGHSESLTSAATISKSVAIVACGESAIFRRTGGASASLFTVSAAGVQLRGLTLEQTETSAVATARIAVSGARFRMISCDVECGQYDNGPALQLDSGANSAEIRSCNFACVSEGSTDQPESAIKSTAALTELRILYSAVTSGSEGFSNPYAIDLSAAAVTRLEVEHLSLLLGSDMKVHASSTGWVNVEIATGSSRVDW